MRLYFHLRTQLRVLRLWTQLTLLLLLQWKLRILKHLSQPTVHWAAMLLLQMLLCPTQQRGQRRLLRRKPALVPPLRQHLRSPCRLRLLRQAGKWDKQTKLRLRPPRRWRRVRRRMPRLTRRQWRWT